MPHATARLIEFILKVMAIQQSFLPLWFLC